MQKDAWFSEKYDPEVLDLLERDRKENCKRMYQDFMEKFNKGFYDKIDLTIKEPVLIIPSSPISESSKIFKKRKNPATPSATSCTRPSTCMQALSWSSITLPTMVSTRICALSS
jgi:hypothetical protein